MHRITFAGLNEADDPEVREALKRMYRKFHRFIIGQVKAHRETAGSADHPDATLTAWSVIALGMMTNITHELGLLNSKAQGKLFQEVGRLLLEGGDDK